jgi:hypothetical protein
LLAFDGHSTCPAGGAHIRVGSGDYFLAVNDPAAPGQPNWKWCNKCYGLSFAGNPSLGPCPKTGMHDHSGSGNYTLLHNVGSPAGTQDQWSWCNKCQLLWFSGGSGASRCPQSPLGSHDKTGSGNYALQGF